MDIIERVKNLLLKPRTEWPRVAAEDATTLSDILFYVSVLAAIGPIATLVRSMGGAMSLAVFAYAFAFIEVFMLAQTVEVLAPMLGGERNFPQSLRLIAYSLTPLWIGDICQFAGLPPAAVLAIGFVTAIYALYLFYLGVAVLKKCAPGKAVAFTALIGVCLTLISVVLAFILLWGLRVVFGLGDGPA